MLVCIIIGPGDIANEEDGLDTSTVLSLICEFGRLILPSVANVITNGVVVISDVVVSED